MKLFTIGFTQTTAESFFERIIEANPELVLDVRRSNASQLAGFAKGGDIAYFLKKICQCEYRHDIMFAPSEKLLENYKKKAITWQDYIVEFDKEMQKNNIVEYYSKNYGNYKSVCLLCSESTPNQCHRRLLAEKLSQTNEGVIHL